ncbi:terminase large subunit phage [Ligilactobacillus acidipiscis DSM 15836]|uniref:Terminase large subunit phage n=1 Tax=Ligilactobacillus acidipiscis DSM 15836 TaxID=1423716 RepID=A0ABR5PPW7_9LACO|nr:PBSX family phage terminase large subunit [Ligilactobacillus acidipiscis]KRM31960.1 terminase large subunit phage [Ligilactobacillus acidipiscis DSM 15836]GAW63078.1 terminase large subunit [Ligilactobacillus acidipiscis]GEN19673.1 terminase [Ligilactobacillus acidipiscis]
MTTVIDVDVDAMINPHFNNVLFSKASNKVLEGGRGSTKSSAISLDIVYKFLQDPYANALVMRKVANTINMSVYEQIKWAIYMLRVNNQFEFKKSPYKIIHKDTGTAIYFSGVDDPQKLKSFIIAKGYVRWLWFEELAEFNSWEEVDTVRASFTRKQLPNDLKVETYYSYNPPKNPYDWINEFVESRRNTPDWYVDHSTYKDVTLPNILAKSYLQEIETVKQNDPDYYRWMYLGEVVGLGTNVYNIDLFHVIDEFPSDDRLLGLYYSVDTGHETSATTCGCYGLTAKGNVILLDNYYYSPAGKAYKKSPTQLAEDLKAFIDRNGREYGMTPMRMTMDSAEGALDNEFYAKYAIHWHKVNKLKKVDMVDRVQDLLAHGRFFMLKKEANKIFYEENKRYQWDEKTLQSDDPKVIKENDHCADQFQYFVRDAERDLGLRW